MERFGVTLPSIDGLDLLPTPLARALPHLMRRAIDLARGGDAPFGCVIADLSTGAVRLEEANTRQSDATAHAEINALRRLQSLSVDPAHLALIATAEPCPMCAAACWWAGVGGIVFGTSIGTLVARGWRQIEMPCRELLDRSRPSSRIIVVGGFMAGETDELYPPPPGQNGRHAQSSRGRV